MIDNWKEKKYYVIIVGDYTMFKVKNSKKGFTLIELLAVIIILGVLLLIAVPTVSKYIEDSRKNAYITI